jgi:hypothetical protein
MRTVDNPEIIEHISSWIKHVSSTKTSNGWPICPYAQNAIMGKRVKMFYYNIMSLDKIVDDFMQDEENFKVWIFVCDPRMDIKTESKVLNDWYHGVLWLWDEAQESGEIDGTKTGNEKYNLLLLQDREELQRMSASLKDKDYYSNWSKEYYDQIVAWRQDANQG